MDNTICTCAIDTVCGDRIYQQTIVKQNSEKSVRDVFRQRVKAIGEFALKVIRSNNAPEPIFSDGRSRVLIRPDRIDLI